MKGGRLLLSESCTCHWASNKLMEMYCSWPVPRSWSIYDNYDEDDVETEDEEQMMSDGPSMDDPLWTSTPYRSPCGLPMYP